MLPPLNCRPSTSWAERFSGRKSAPGSPTGIRPILSSTGSPPLPHGNLPLVLFLPLSECAAPPQPRPSRGKDSSAPYQTFTWEPVLVHRTQIQFTNQSPPFPSHTHDATPCPCAPPPHEQVLASSPRPSVGGAPRAQPRGGRSHRDVTSVRAWPRFWLRGRRGGTEVAAVGGGGAEGQGAHSSPDQSRVPGREP